MKIIMLTGASNIGKTTALIKLYDSLLKMGIHVESKEIHPNGFDIIARFNYNAQSIYLFTMGDNVKGIMEQFEVALKDNFDWFVCANSCKLQPYRMFEESELGITISKKRPTDEDENRIINRIINILDNAETFA